MFYSYIEETSDFNKLVSDLGGKDNILRAVPTGYGGMRIFLKNSDATKNVVRTDPEFPDSKVWFKSPLAEADPAVAYYVFSENTAFKEQLLSAFGPVGDRRVEEPSEVITFGRYEQGKGVEPIEWLVLERIKDGPKTRMLLLSLYGLELRPFNRFEFKTTWETSPLRQWLNEDFLQTAFDPDEIRAICTTHVVPDIPPKGERSGDPGNDTQDRIFLLSISEVLRYLPYQAARLCKPPKALIEPREAYGEDYCSWWLRSPGLAPYQAANITAQAQVYKSTSISNKYTAVRPAIWIEM